MSLSELCVRRPVFATMLVMSLVVLGIFSFRDLGVDLFPKADPATVNVTVQLPGASPGEMVDGGRRAARRGAQQHLRHRRDVVAAHQRRPRADHRASSCSSATSTTPPTTCARRWPGAHAQPAAADPAAGHPEGRSRLRSDHVDRPVVRHDEPAHAHRDRRQAGEARASKRSTASARSISAAAAPREIHIVVDVEKLNGYGLTIEQVQRGRRRREHRGARRHRRAGQVGDPAAHARPRRRRRGVQPHHHRDRERHADPRLGHRLRRGHDRAAAPGGVAERRARR